MLTLLRLCDVIPSKTLTGDRLSLWIFPDSISCTPHFLQASQSAMADLWSGSLWPVGCLILHQKRLAQIQSLRLFPRLPPGWWAPVLIEGSMEGGAVAEAGPGSCRSDWISTLLSMGPEWRNYVVTATLQFVTALKDWAERASLALFLCLWHWFSFILQMQGSISTGGRDGAEKCVCVWRGEPTEWKGTAKKHTQKSQFLKLKRD